MDQLDTLAKHMIVLEREQTCYDGCGQIDCPSREVRTYAVLHRLAGVHVVKYMSIPKAEQSGWANPVKVQL